MLHRNVPPGGHGGGGSGGTAGDHPDAFHAQGGEKCRPGTRWLRPIPVNPPVLRAMAANRCAHRTTGKWIAPATSFGIGQRAEMCQIGGIMLAPGVSIFSTAGTPDEIPAA
jgi:hypothetical protein